MFPGDTNRTGAPPQIGLCFAILPGNASNCLNSDRINTMRRNPRLFRLTATVALTALLWDAMLPLAAVAQPAPPPLPPLPAPGQGRPDLTIRPTRRPASAASPA